MADFLNIDNRSKGVFPQQDGTFLAMTLTQSKDFKTERGAINWLAKFGIDKNGKKIN